MTKALVLSLLVLTIVVPIHLARDPRPHRGLRRTLLGMSGVIAAWGLACAYLYTRLG
jgi:hypothetical protein